MSPLSEGVKDLLVPGSAMFLLLALAAGLALLYAGGRYLTWGRRWLTAIAAAYLIMALPVTCDVLTWGLCHGYSSFPRVDSARVRTIVVLGNGAQARRAAGQQLDVLKLSSAFSALETRRMDDVLGGPLVIASGGRYHPALPETESDIMRAALVRLGIPEYRIVLERESRTTREQAANVAAMLRQRGISDFLLVTSPDHMRRAVGVFEKSGLNPVPAVSQLRYGGTAPFWPTRYALQGTEAATYEYIALAYYWVRGWL